MITSKIDIFLILVILSTGLFNFNLMNPVQVKVGVKQFYNKDSQLSCSSTNKVGECIFLGPTNNMYVTIVNNGTIPVSREEISGFVD